MHTIPDAYGALCFAGTSPLSAGNLVITHEFEVRYGLKVEQSGVMWWTAGRTNASQDA